MDLDKRYYITVRPARLGHVSKVHMESRHAKWMNQDGLPEWTGWDPQPAYWRPTEMWAIRRAERKMRKFLREDGRMSSERVIYETQRR